MRAGEGSAGAETDTFWFGSVPQAERTTVDPFRVPRFHRTLSDWVDMICAAGLMIGHALIAPGRLSRMAALRERGREATTLIYGAALMTTGAAVIAAAAFLVGSMVTDRDNAPLALGMLALSYPIFLVMKRFSARAATQPT